MAEICENNDAIAIQTFLARKPPDNPSGLNCLKCSAYNELSFRHKNSKIKIYAYSSFLHVKLFLPSNPLFVQKNEWIRFEMNSILKYTSIPFQRYKDVENRSRGSRDMIFWIWPFSQNSRFSWKIARAIYRKQVNIWI